MGLIKARHNELRDGVVDLANKAFTPAHVRDDPKFFTGHTVRGGQFKAKFKGEPSKDEGDMKGDILIRDLWMQGTDGIHDVRVVNSDAVSHRSQNL